MKTITTDELETAQGGYYGWPGPYGYGYGYGYGPPRNPYWAYAQELRAEARAAAYWNNANANYWPLFAAAALSRPQPPTVIYY